MRCLLFLIGVIPLCSLNARAEDISCDLLIVGATESGWAAAVQAARLGMKSITVVHDGSWYGGQYTEQALACVDENKGVGKVGWGVDWHPMKRSFHRSGLFKELMDGIEAFNTEKYGSPMPGKPFHGPSTFRPAEAEAVFRRIIQPYVDSGQIRVYWNRYPVRTDLDGETLTGVWFAPVVECGGPVQPDLHVTAKMTVDASDWGEVIQLSGTAYECGPDPQSRYGEPSAAPDMLRNPPNEMNPITWAMIVVESAAETPIPRPPHFDDRNYPRATPFSRQAFGDLQWDVPNPGIGCIAHWPAAGAESQRQLSVYSVRRIVDGYTSKDGKTSILLNYMNGQDYPLERLPQRVVQALEATEPGASEKNIVEMTRAQRHIIFTDAKQHSLGVLYHLQNFVHDRAADKTNSFRRFHLSDEFGTPDHLPPKPYIRESLRLKAMYMMREQDGRNRDGKTKTAAKERFAYVMYPDGLFAWQFHYDFHRTGRTYLESEGSSGPWIDYHKPNRHTKFSSDRSLFPLRSLVPKQTDGLLGAQGNIGVSSIVSAALRLHDQRIHVGQAAAAVAVVAMREKIQPREIPYRRESLEAVRRALCGEVTDAVPLLLWPFRDLPADHRAFVAVNRLAALGLLPLADREVDFRPDELATPEWIQRVLKHAGKHRPDLRAELQTRGDFCRVWWEQIERRGFGDFYFPRQLPQDADADGILDADDPLSFTPNEPIRFQIGVQQLGPENDGIADESLTASPAARFFDFCGTNGKPTTGGEADHGKPFDTARGFGWLRDLSDNHRRRNALDGPRDTFIFTRGRDVWECRVENGRYRVTVCVGDARHEQPLQSVTIEGTLIVDQETTAAGRFAEVTATVNVNDGRLTVQIGANESSSNTCLNWLIVEKL